MKWAAVILSVSTVLGFAVSPSHAAFTHTWDSASGQFPDADCFWHLTTTNPALATFDSGRLKIATGPLGDGHYYFQAGSELAPPDPWVIEARVRIDTDHGTSVPATSAAIGFATAADVENLLFIGAGNIYLWSGAYVMGPQVFLDTQSAPRTYRIEVTGAGVVSVFVDGVLTLSGTLLSSPAFEDSEYLWWGDGTSYASGTSFWESFTHNGNALESCLPTPAQHSTWGRIKRLYR